MLTIELNRRLIAVMGGSRDEVEEFAESDSFRADLLAFVGKDDHQLWDDQGVFSPLVREALPEEAATFDQSFGQDVAAGEADLDDPGDWLAFLMDVRHTTVGSDST